MIILFRLFMEFAGQRGESGNRFHGVRLKVDDVSSIPLKLNLIL